MAARDEPVPQRFTGNDLSEDTTDTMVLRPVRPQRPQQRPQQRPTRHHQRPSRPAEPPPVPAEQSGPGGPPDPPDEDDPRPSSQPPEPPRRRKPSVFQTSVRTVGEVFITFGIVILLFVVYELYITSIFTAIKQAEASAALQRRWSQKPAETPQRQIHIDPMKGKAFARIFIPSFGVDYNFTIQEGVSAHALSIGPGHYPDSAMPGQPGNFAVAGHRVGKGAPFNDLDLLESCDAIVIETATDFFVYRVLPMKDEVANWEQGKGRLPKCDGVSTLRNPSLPGGGPYGKVYGRKIVEPTVGSAVAPVPYRPNSDLPKSEQVALLTLTTCHPQFTAEKRMIIHAVLVRQLHKTPQSGGYKQVLREIGVI